MSHYGRKRGGKGIPDRWLDYKAVGKRLNGTRFVAFKVPLKQALTRELSRSEVFGPWELLDELRKDGQELGLVIDLTFTTRYYKLQDIPKSLLCVKIFTAGHEVPSDAKILSFKRAVRRFLRDNEGNDKLIGVHCTHGLNRTGYLICRYLIDVDGMDPKRAVDLFNSARGHDIERQNYLDDLQNGPKRSNQGMDESDPELEPQRGFAERRPCSRSEDRDDGDEDGRLHGSDSWNRRPFPPPPPPHRSHHHLPPSNGLLPDPPLLPLPPQFRPHAGAPFHHYQWPPAPPPHHHHHPPPPPHRDTHWRRPPPPTSSSSDRWSRAAPSGHRRTRDREEVRGRDQRRPPQAANPRPRQYEWAGPNQRDDY